MDLLKRIYTQLSDFLRTMSPGKKLGVFAAFGGIIVGLILLFYWASDTTYEVLKSNLSPEDSTSVIRILRDKKIPFKVEDGGRMVKIPKEKVYDLRLELASMGLPDSSVAGYELFDKQSFGTTSFVQKINQKRALEGELTRTIKNITGIKKARVHLVMPEESTFIEDQKQPTAAVALELEPGFTISESQISGIGKLVASSVSGLDLKNVTIVDTFGKKLSKNESDEFAGATLAVLDLKARLEKQYETRIIDMLGKVVGEGKVIAQVAVDLDSSQVHETQTSYDNENAAIASTQKDIQSADGSRPSPIGPPGVKSNLPNQGANATDRNVANVAGGTGAAAVGGAEGNTAETQTVEAGKISNNTKRTHEVINYNVPSTVKNVKKGVAELRKISVAVLVDGKYKPVLGNDGFPIIGDDGNPTTKFEQWEPEKIKEFETIVSGAIGFNKDRGDVIEIKNMEFQKVDFNEAERLASVVEKRNLYNNVLKYGLISVIIFVFFLAVVRPFIKWITENTVDSVEDFLPQTIEELEKIQKNQILPELEEAMPTMAEKVDPEKVEGEMIKEKIINLIEAHPQKAATIIHDWIHEKVPVTKDKAEAKSA